EGMPAAESGLKAGDLLLEIDGKDLKGNSDVGTLLRGQVGTSFKLKVQRPGVKEPLEFNIVRRSIQMPTIPYYGVMDGQVGYINLSSFSGNPSKDFKKAFLDLKKQGITSLVIDLRNNGGGLLDQAVEIVNMFVPRGKTIVTTKGKIKQASNTYKTLREPLDTDIPIAVLVNSGTASSSEILSGSLQDLDRAVIVGNRTYGKGLVQVPRSLPYGGNLKITTSKYYIPSGRCVQAIDYAHRNEDGSVARIPDSLTTVFHTAAGREVRDGGGVSPDIEVKQERLPNILFYLVRDNLIFDYATDYCLKHPAIASAKEFELTDADYEEFKNKVKGADFKYDQQSEKILNTLKEAAEFEGYMKDASDEFKALENKLKHNLDRDLDYFSKDIKKMIAEEIIKRYYYQEGAIIQQLKDDKDLDEAVKVLTNPERYQQILSVTAVTAKKE
ncbi:S41 family peptidase, partial [Bacteroides sp. CAG:189]|uniref:S41 family peptidase n=1 Tax=Bacteroides sp. CAG:189 TaxID=1262737 RepID=UPI002582612A